jgi:hypothetical protein
MVSKIFIEATEQLMKDLKSFQLHNENELTSEEELLVSSYSQLFRTLLKLAKKVDLKERDSNTREQQNILKILKAEQLTETYRGRNLYHRC